MCQCFEICLEFKKVTSLRFIWAWFPNLAITVLACARIGAPHSVIFGGFSSQAIADRVEDAQIDSRHHM